MQIRMPVSHEACSVLSLDTAESATLEKGS